MEADQPKAESPKRKLRWFQFRLRTWFIVVAIISVLLWFCEAAKTRPPHPPATQPPATKP
jgi:hypothetical protein